MRTSPKEKKVSKMTALIMIHFIFVIVFFQSCSPHQSNNGNGNSFASDSGSNSNTNEQPSQNDDALPDTDSSKQDYVTEIIGQSQTNHWFDYVNEQQIILNRWQGRINEGSGYMNWRDPNFAIWTSNIYKPAKSGNTTNGAAGIVIGSDETLRSYQDIERVVITVGKSPEETGTAGTYESLLEETIVTVRTKYPNLKEIRLQALATGPEGTICRAKKNKKPGDPPGVNEEEDVRTNVNFERIQQAIAYLISQHNDVKAGPILRVSDCLHFGDSTGHMTADGNIEVANQVVQFYKPN